MHSHSNTVLILSSVSWSITYNHVVAIDYQNRRYNYILTQYNNIRVYHNFYFLIIIIYYFILLGIIIV